VGFFELIWLFLPYSVGVEKAKDAIKGYLFILQLNIAA
jgi:hypothetical protein